MTHQSSVAHRHSPKVPGKTRWDHPILSTRANYPASSLEASYVGEESCAYLTRFETVVLVDDSNSMSGPPWQLASDLLADMTKIVATFHPNGLELHFFNQANYDLKNATAPELIRRLFAIVEPAGASSPIATLLERELSKYISRYRNDSKLRGLNLLVLTNGVPDDKDRILEVISQASIETEFLSAGKEKISIQFIQIGPNKALQTFLERLDDAYAMALIHNHIVVKRIPWHPKEKDALLQKVFFGGVRQQWIHQTLDKLPERRMYQLETPSIRQVLLVALMNHSTHNVKGEDLYYTSFDLRWELSAFVRDHLGEGEKLSQVITLTGTPINAQASTCEQYIREFWPNIGPPLLFFIENVCDKYRRHLSEVWMIKRLLGEGSFIGVEIKIKSDKTIINVDASLESQIEVTEILAWLTAAVRSSTPPSLSSSEADLTFKNYEARLTFENYEADPDFENYEADPNSENYEADLTFENYGSELELAYFKLQPGPLNPVGSESQMCWHPLFEHSVIAVQFPYTPRTQGVGVELSPILMATLAGVRTAVEFRGGLILRGLSTALIPLETTGGEDAIQWHLETTKMGDDAIITDLFVDFDEIEGIDGYYKVQDVQQLWAKKAYLGWCSVTTVLLGTQEAKYQKVTWSDPAKVRKTMEFSGVSLSLGSAGLGFGGPTATANFVIPKTQRTHFMDVENQLKVRLNISITRSVIVYDTLDRRGWMIPIVCLMLYMMHVRVQKLPKPSEASEDGLTAMPYSTGEGEAGREAFEILTRYMEPGFASTLGNSENWKETLALFYIALNTFFGKAKELNSKSSEISGFELMDVALAESPFRYSSRKIPRNSGGWAQLGDVVGFLFCSGIGDAIVPGAGANVLCSPWSRVPTGFDYLGAYLACVIEVLSRQGKHKASDRLRQRIGYDLYNTCHHAAKSQCSRLQSYSQIANPPNARKRRMSEVSRSEEPPSAENLSSHGGAIIFGKKTRLVKPWPGT